MTPTSLTVPGPGTAAQALTIQTTTATPVGTHTLMVRVTGGTVTREATFTLTVTAAPGPQAQIAFTSNRDGNFEIYLMNADGTNQRNLTNNAANDQQPAWSPASR